MADVLLTSWVGREDGGGRQGSGIHRTIAAAAVVFAIAAFALQSSTAAGAFAEPLLLLVMGTLFLVVGKLFGGVDKAPTPQLVERRA